MKDVIPQLYELVTKVVGLDKVIGVGHDMSVPRPLPSRSYDFVVAAALPLPPP